MNDRVNVVVEDNVTNIAEMKEGHSGVVASLSGGQAFVKKAEAMGIRPGTRFVKTSSSYLSGPVTIKVGNLRLALGLGIASKVIVEDTGEGE